MADARTVLVITALCVVLLFTTTCARMPPTLTEEPPMNVDLIPTGGEVELPCAAVGDPEPEITWLKDGEPVTYDQFKEFRSGYLVLTTGSVIDVGYYQCVATNDYGKALSRVAYAQFVVLGRFDEITTIRQVNARVGESLTIPCNPPKSQPPPTFAWGVQDQDAEVGATPTAVTLDKRVQIDEEGNLLFSNVVSGDARPGKNYICQVHNTKLLSSAGGSLHQVTVNSGTPASRVPNIMYKTSGPVVGIVGKSVTLQCLFSGYPTPTVSWKKKGGNIPTQGRGTQTNYNTKLTITDIRLEDEGTYICSASSAAGRNAGDEEIYLEVNSIPTYNSNQKPVNVNMTNDDEAIIQCSTSAIPAATNQWYINGDPIARDTMPPRMVLDNNDRTLKIRKLCKDCEGGDRTTDLMVIQCNSSNIHGYAFAQGYLNVLNRTEIYVAPPDERVLELDEDSIDLPCSARSDSSTPVTVTWYKGSDPISSLGDDRLLVGPAPDNLLTIDLIDLSLEEKGPYQDTYRCQADNGYSTAARTTELTVKGAPAPVVASAGFEWWWIIIIIVLVLLLLIILLCCCLCCHRNKGDDYDVEKMEKKNGNQPEKENRDNDFHEYQRPETQPIKGSRASLASSVPLDSDDDDMADEYGDIDTGRFNEDGSFIGQYNDKKKTQHV